MTKFHIISLVSIFNSEQNQYVCTKYLELMPAVNYRIAEAQEKLRTFVHCQIVSQRLKAKSSNETDDVKKNGSRSDLEDQLIRWKFAF